MIKAVIFDFDGVLVESVDIKTKAFARLFKEEGSGIVKKVVAYHTGNTGISRFEKFQYIYKYILNRTLSKERFGYLCDKFSEFVVGEVVVSPYVKGAENFLNKYYKHYKLFLVSATPQSEIKFIITRRSMGRYFKNVYGAPNKKCDSVKKIIRATYLSPKEVVYIGDALSDYQAATVNGINFIARINEDGRVFAEALRCKKIKNLVNLYRVLRGF